MAENKTSSFSTEDQRSAELFKALSHPARITILRVLAEKGECICGEIVSLLPLAQSTVSQHLKELKNAGFIKGEIEGPRSCYCIDWENLESFEKNNKALLGSLLKLRSKQNCC